MSLKLIGPVLESLRNYALWNKLEHKENFPSVKDNNNFTTASDTFPRRRRSLGAFSTVIFTKKKLHLQTRSAQMTAADKIVTPQWMSITGITLQVVMFV